MVLGTYDLFDKKNQKNYRLELYLGKFDRKYSFFRFKHVRFKQNFRVKQYFNVPKMKK